MSDGNEDTIVMDRWMAERVWFLRTEHTDQSFSMDSVPPAERYKNIQELLGKDMHSCQVQSYIFLVRAPLTFGHSQLVMKAAGGHEEAMLFEMIAPIVKGAISVFEHMFRSRLLHESPEFKALAELTKTRKRYLKTLVLRTSAKEDAEKGYKVHLVPYFASHAGLCEQRYRGIHHLDSGTGGLLGWLGERETEVDRWQIPSENPWAVKLDEIANINLKMKWFAQLFTEAWR